MFKLRVLGGTDLLKENGDRVTSIVAQPKRFALLTYLVMEADPTVSRDQVLSVFWPDIDEKRARAALSQALYKLRQSLGPDSITNVGDHLIGVDRSLISCDASEFLGLDGAGKTLRALDTYRGPFLEAFHLSDAWPFMEWASAKATALSQRVEELSRMNMEGSRGDGGPGIPGRAVTTGRRATDTTKRDAGLPPARFRLRRMGLALAVLFVVALLTLAARASDGFSARSATGSAPFNPAELTPIGERQFADRSREISREVMAELAVAGVSPTTRTRLETAMEFARRGMDADPTDPVAVAGLVLAGGLLEREYGTDQSRLEYLVSMEALASRALEEHPDDALALKTLVNVLKGTGRLVDAADLLTAGIEMHSSDGVVNGLHNQVLTSLGRFLEVAINKGRNANIEAMGNISVFMGDFAGAKHWYDEADRLSVPIDPESPGMTALGLEYDLQAMRADTAIFRAGRDAAQMRCRYAHRFLVAGDARGAARALDWGSATASPFDCTGNSFWSGMVGTTLRGFAHREMGNQLLADSLFAASEAFDHLVMDHGNDWFLPRYDLARISAIRGQKEAAYQWLQKAIEAGWRYYYWYGWGPTDPMLSALHGEKRFDEMMRWVKFRVDSMRVELPAR